MLNGVKKCGVCRKFCKKTATKCPGCGITCHDKCRQSICCRPCNVCWATRIRTCVCGKSFRSLGVPLKPLSTTPVTNSQDAPPSKRKKTSNVPPQSCACATETLQDPVSMSTPLSNRHTTFETPEGDKENVRVKINAHTHRYTHAHMNKQMHTYMHTHRQIHTYQSHMHTRVHVDIHTHTHTHTHMHRHTHTCYTHTCLLMIFEGE